MKRFESFELSGKVAAISGAGSGIGRALAKELAHRGCALSLADIDEQGLRTTRELVAPITSATITAHVVDVAQRSSVEDWANATVEAHGGVQLVFNNAGVTLLSGVEDSEYHDIEWLMGINLWGVIYGTKAFLPHIDSSPGEGAVVNVSSVFGLIGIPGQSAYNASKFAVRGFTEALRAEVAEAGRAIHVACVHPGGIKTSIARTSRIRLPGELRERDELVRSMERLFLHTPDEAARRIADGVQKREHRILIGSDAYVLDWLSRLFPVRHRGILVSLFKKKWGRSQVPRFR